MKGYTFYTECFEKNTLKSASISLSLFFFQHILQSVTCTFKNLKNI